MLTSPSDIKSQDASVQNALALLAASARGQTDVVESLLTPRKTSICVCSTDRDTALHLAARRGHALTLDCLLRLGAHPLVNCLNSRSDTALSLAAQRGCLASCKLLVAYGADISHGNSALAIADERGPIRLTAFLSKVAAAKSLPLADSSGASSKPGTHTKARTEAETAVLWTYSTALTSSKQFSLV